nr:hypothetical protein [Tanacetum cinerariifolium]
MDASLSSDHAFDFFAAEPVLGLAEAPNNQNGWIEWDVPLGGEMDEPMENLIFDEAEELDEFMDDDEDVLDEDEYWLMASVTPLRATVVSRLEKIETRVQQNQELLTRVAEMESREGIFMSSILWMEERLTILEKRLLTPPSRTQQTSLFLSYLAGLGSFV